MVKKNKTEEEKKEIAHGMKLRLITKKNDYIKNLINGRYYLARCNMIAAQLQSKNIQESIDGCKKTDEYLRSEYALMKYQAISSMRNAHFAGRELIQDFKLTNNDLLDIEKDYYEGKIIREEYDEAYNGKGKAEFVNSSKD